jgi:hypothetical protein
MKGNRLGTITRDGGGGNTALDLTTFHQITSIHGQ